MMRERERCIVAQIKHVYAANAGILDWHAEEVVTTDRWAELMHMALPEGNYNWFDVDKTHAWLSRFDVMLEPAREGSVAVYVHGGRDVLDRIVVEAEAHSVDEWNYEGDVLRLWWD